MFGKHHWFVKKRYGWGLSPISWQGWFYSAVWCAVMILPFTLMLWLGLVPQAGIWLVASIGVLVWDVKEILGEMAPAGPGQPAESQELEDELFVIDENETESERFYTRNYDLEIR